MDVVVACFFGRVIPPQPGEGRHDRLARAVLASDLFAKTFVDRTWAQLFGRGIVEPWDDLYRSIAWAMNVDPNKTRFAPSGRPVKTVDGAAMIGELF